MAKTIKLLLVENRFMEKMMVKVCFNSANVRTSLINLAFLFNLALLGYFGALQQFAFAAEPLKDEALKTEIELQTAVVVPTEVAAPDIATL